MDKFDECHDVQIEFSNASSDLQKAIKLRDGSTKDIEQETTEINSEFLRRRDRLQFHEKLVKGFHRALGQFKNTINATEEWCDMQTKDIAKMDVNDRGTAKAEIMKIDVSPLWFLFV